MLQVPSGKRWVTRLRRVLLTLLALALAAAVLILVPGWIRWFFPQTRYQIAEEFALVSVDGTLHSLAEHRGHSIVLVFIASWCEICRAEMPTMVQAYREHMAHNVIFLAVDSYEDRTTVEKFRDELHVTFPILVDSDGAVAQRFHIGGTPTSYFIDRQGRVRDVVIGGPLSGSYLDKEIAPLLPHQFPVP